MTASRHADLVLAAAGVADCFDARVDGDDVDALGLAGKPDPATFVEAARRLGVHPGACVVVEDAIAGVEAGRRGALRPRRRRRPERRRPTDLRRAGADIVVADLADLPTTRCGHRPSPGSSPTVASTRPSEGTREALLTLGNGYLATRGAMAHATADDVHYPGTYVAGRYNRLCRRSTVATGRTSRSSTCRTGSR